MATDLELRTSARSLRDHLETRRDEMVDLLLDLVRDESPSHDAASQAEPIRKLTAAFEDVGLRVRHVRGRTSGGCLLATMPQRGRGMRGQLLLGHCDTVWPIGTLADMPAEVRDGRLYGPGSYDMKAGLVHMIFALRALRDVGLTPAVPPLVFINSDEEIGSGDSTPHIRRIAATCDRAFVLEPSLGPEGRLKTARKGVGRFLVTVDGRAAHAGLDPEHGRSAILEMAHVVQSLFELNDPASGVSVNVGTIEGGTRPNVIAAQSRAVVDIRVLDHEHAERLERAVNELQPVTPDTTLRVEGGFGRPPMEHTPGNRTLWVRAQQAADELGVDLQEGTAGGGSDGNTTSLFAPTLDGMGAVGAGAHALHEQVELEPMPARVALLARLMLEPPMA